MHPIRFTAINCGFFISPMSFFRADGGSDPLRAPVPCFLVEHPRGKLLFDCGMNLRFRDQMKDSPAAKKGMGIDMDENHVVSARLLAMGIDPREIQYVALSHLHLDHCAGLEEIPNATLLIQRAECEVAFGSASQLYDKSYFDLGHPIKKIDGEYDVFGDGTVVLFPTRGHTPGHQSIRVRLPDRDVVIAADCCYLNEVLEDFSKLQSASSSDHEEHLRSLQLLRDLQAGGARIVCGHDPKDLILSAQTPALLV